MKRPRDASGRHPRPAGANRDLIWISVVALAAFSIGVAFDVFGRLDDAVRASLARRRRQRPRGPRDPGGIVRGRVRPGSPASRTRRCAPRGDRATLPRARRAGAGDHLHVEPVDHRGRGRHDLHQPAGGAPPRLHPRRVDVLAHVLERAHPLRRSRPGDRSVGTGGPRRHGVPRGVPDSSRRTAGSSGSATNHGRSRSTRTDAPRACRA